MKKILVSGFALVSCIMSGCVAYVYDGGWYYGRYDHGGYYHPCRYRPCYKSESFITSEESAQLLAQDYGLSNESAKKMVTFAQMKNRAQAAAALGVSPAEMAPLAKLEMPSHQTIRTVATTLDEDESKIEHVMKDLISDIKSEKLETH